ncbi:MAG TPA: hypothetical protein VGO62_07135 [Myxococcota bacterium]
MRRSLVVVIALLAACAACAACGQSQECKQYVACQNDYDSSVDTTPYEPDGTCWTTLQTASECTQHCKDALGDIRQLASAPKSCRG